MNEETTDDLGDNCSCDCWQEDGVGGAGGDGGSGGFAGASPMDASVCDGGHGGAGALVADAGLADGPLTEPFLSSSELRLDDHFVHDAGDFSTDAGVAFLLVLGVLLAIAGALRGDNP